MNLFVGIDWGSRVHSVCVLEADGTRRLEQEVAHEGDAVLGFVQTLSQLAEGDWGRVRVAMESPHGTMIEALLEAGAVAFHLNPKQLDRFRDRHTVAGAKDDALDALVLADSLRTDEKLFRRVPKISQFLVRLRAENRTAKQLMDHMLAVSFQVRDELQRYYPEMLRLGSWHNEPWLWDLVTAAPTPQAARKLREPRVQNILKLRRIRRYTAQQVLDSLRATPLPVAEGVAEACSQAVLALLPLLQTMHEQRKQCLKRIDSLLDQAVVEPKQVDVKDEKKEQGKVLGGQTAESESHRAMLRDAALLLTLPGLGRRIVTSVLARAHLALHERDYSALRRLAGVAPVSRRTGGRSKSPMVAMRRARDAELTNAVYLWAWAATRLDPGFKARYAALRAKGVAAPQHPRDSVREHVGREFPVPSVETRV